MTIEDLEQSVLRRAREQYETSPSKEDSALAALGSRIAAAPFAALSGLELPPIPDPITGAIAAGSSTSAAAATASSASVSSAAVSSTAGVAAVVGVSTKGAVAAGLLHLTPLKFLAATLLVGGGAAGVQASYSQSDAPSEAAQTSFSLEKVASFKVNEPKPRRIASQAVKTEAEELQQPEEPAADRSRKAATSSAKASPRVRSAREPAQTKNVEAEPAVSRPARDGPAIATFNDELHYLRQAQGALKSGGAARALRLMSLLDAERPRGSLLPERRMTKVLALCSLGRVSEALAIARIVLDSKSGPLYAPRLRNSCASSVGSHDASKN